MTSAGGGTLAAGASAVVDAAVGVGITSGVTDGVTATSGVTDGVGATVVSLAGSPSDAGEQRLPHRDAGGDDHHTQDGGEHPRAPALLVAAALHELVEQVGRGRADQVGVAVQGGAQVEVVHRAPSGVRVVAVDWSSSSRRRARPRDAWLFTEPTEHPRASAVSASERPS